MKTWMMLALVLMFWAAMPALAQEKQPEPPRDEKEKEEEAKKNDLDVTKPYRTKGNTWTHKMSTKAGDFESVTYMKCEITDVTETTATVKTTTLNEKKEEIASSTYEHDLKAPEGKVEEKEDAKVKKSEEKIKVEAGEFDCTKIVTEADGTTNTMWLAKDSGLLVKSHSKSELHEVTVELTESKIS